MAEKTVKVDEAVHRRLEELKRKHGAETFNEVLRYELDIVSSPDIDELAAFLHQELTETVRDAVEVVREIGDFREQVKEERNREVLEFSSVESGRVICSIEFDESSFQFKYRGQGGEMKDCGRGWCNTTTEMPKYGRMRNTSDYTEPEDVVDQVKTKVSGANGRWGD